MKNNFLYLVSAVILFSSCATDKVINDSWIQKRKYTKGFYIAKKATTEKAAKIERAHIIKEIIPLEKAPVLSATIANPMEMELKTKIERPNPFRVGKTVVSPSDVSLVFKKNKKNVQNKRNKPSPAYIHPAIYAISFILMVLIALYIPALSIGFTTSWSGTSFFFTDFMWFSYIFVSLLYGVFVLFFS